MAANLAELSAGRNWTDDPAPNSSTTTAQMRRSAVFASNIIHSIGQTTPEVCDCSHIRENSVTGTSVTLIKQSLSARFLYRTICASLCKKPRTHRGFLLCTLTRWERQEIVIESEIQRWPDRSREVFHQQRGQLAKRRFHNSNPRRWTMMKFFPKPRGCFRSGWGDHLLSPFGGPNVAA